jgi:hypothetical protein
VRPGSSYPVRLKQVILADVPSDGIVRVDGEWGVVARSNSTAPWNRRAVDFWVGGLQWVPVTKPVEWMEDAKP